MGSFGKDGATDITRGYSTRGTNLDHNDPPTKKEGRIKWHWVGRGDMEDDHHYHKQPPQDVHLSP